MVEVEAPTRLAISANATLLPFARPIAIRARTLLTSWRRLPPFNGSMECPERVSLVLLFSRSFEWLVLAADESLQLVQNSGITWRIGGYNSGPILFPIYIAYTGNIRNESTQLFTATGHKIGCRIAGSLQIANIFTVGIVHRQPVDPSVRQQRLFATTIEPRLDDIPG